MSINSDTDDILSVWGETVTIVRNSITIDDYGNRTDSWVQVDSVEADLQPMTTRMTAREIGFEKKSTHAIYVPSTTTIAAGDRLRPSGWSAGNDEYVVTGVWVYEDHLEVHALRVEGHG